MRLLAYRSVLVLCCVFLSGCAVKTYQGPELLDEQVATFTLKAPAMSLIPLFWVFPLNMLTWLSDDDWQETSGIDSVTVSDTELNRFNSVKTSPGPIAVKSQKRIIVDEFQIGYDSCLRSTRKIKDKNGKVIEEETTTCSAPFQVDENIVACEILMNAEAGQHYQVFIRNRFLMLVNLSSRQVENPLCHVVPNSYVTTKSSSSTHFEEHHKK